MARPGTIASTSPRKISILANRPVAQDGSGQSTPNWVVVATAWTMQWESISGRTFFAAEQIKADATHKLRIRFMASVPVLPGYRMQYGSRLFDINASLNDGEQNQYLDLYVKEVPPKAN